MNRGQLKLWIWLGSFPLLIVALFAYVVLWNYFALRNSAVVFMVKNLGIHNFDVREVQVERYFNDSKGRVFIYLDQPFDFDDLDKRKFITRATTRKRNQTACHPSKLLHYWLKVCISCQWI